MSRRRPSFENPHALPSSGCAGAPAGKNSAVLPRQAFALFLSLLLVLTGPPPVGAQQP